MRKDMHRSLGRDAARLTTSKMITSVISMLSSMILSRYRTLEEYGTYSQLLMVINLVTTLFMLGLPNSINYFLARAETEEEKQSFMSTYYTLSTILSIVVGLTLIASVPIMVEYFDNEMIKNFIYLLAVYPWTKIVMSSIENILIVYRKTTLIILYRVTNSIALMTVLLFVQIFNYDFNTYMKLFVLVEVIFSLSVYVIVNKVSGNLKISINKKLTRNILFFSVPIGLASVIGTLNIELDKLMIGNFLNTEQLAIYTNASREMPVTIIASSITAVLLPSLSKMLKKGNNQEAVNLWGHATELSYIILSFIATSLFVFAPEVMTLLYSEKYLSGVPIFRVYNIVLLLRATYFGMILNAKGRTKLIFYSSILSLILNVFLNYILFKTLGIIGPSIATFFSQLVVNILQIIFTTKIIEVPFMKILPWKKLGVITIINVFLGILFHIIKAILPIEMIVGEITESVFLGSIWTLLYVTLFNKNLKENWRLLNI